MNLPNRLTITRLLFVPIFALIYLFPYESYGITIPSVMILTTRISLRDVLLFVIFVIASLTDFFDGHLARSRNMVTTFGKFIDPIADKLIVNTALLLLVSSETISVIVPIVMISRDTIVDGIRLIASQKNIVLAASYLGKAKTMIQMMAICLLLLHNVIFEYFGIPMDQILIWIATGISLISGADYFMKNSQYITETM